MQKVADVQLTPWSMPFVLPAPAGDSSGAPCHVDPFHLDTNRRPRESVPVATQKVLDVQDTPNRMPPRSTCSDTQCVPFQWSTSPPLGDRPAAMHQLGDGQDTPPSDADPAEAPRGAAIECHLPADLLMMTTASVPFGRRSYPTAMH